MALPESQNYLLDNPDLLWHLEHSVRWDEIVRITENDFKLPDGPGDTAEAVELYRSILEEVGRFVAREIAPRAEALDAQGTRLEDGEVVLSEAMQDIFRGLAGMELFGLCVPRELGGMNCPLALSFMIGELIARADCGVMTHFSFFNGIAMSLLLYSAREGSMALEDGRFKSSRFERAIRECASGDQWGAMVLTEPDAGSDLGAIRMRAVLSAEGRWRLSGEKIFITSGHGQHQIVLARTAERGEADPTGLKGLSLFLVPRWIEREGERVENVSVTKVEKKLGHCSSPTVSLLYEDSEAELIGEQGQGFELMLILMNNARIAVGFEALGVCEAALRMAFHYACERRTMGKRLVEHELLADMLLEMDTDVRALRALCFEALNAGELSQKLDMKLMLEPPADPDERERMRRRARSLMRRARDLTPLVKYFGAEKAVEITRRNMQLHGGMGYILETGADRLLRDALVLPIYEGTSQIQALMALKDHLGKVIKDPAGFLREGASLRLKAQTARGLERSLCRAELKLHQATEAVLARILGAKVRSDWSELLKRGSAGEWLRYFKSDFMRTWDAKHDFAHGLVHAERLTRMLCDVHIGTILLRQGEEHPERMVYARRYITRMLPRVSALAEEIQAGADLEDLKKIASEEG